jgi:lactate dehydrogenase-like 2-hydroxyacid dehydrogenase
MESVNVLVSSAIGDKCLRQIAGISSRINLIDISGLLRAERNGDLTSRAKLDVMLAKAEVIYGFRFPENIITRAPKLKWIQVMSAGVDF